jgi:hypothetical protein
VLVGATPELFIIFPLVYFIYSKRLNQMIEIEFVTPTSQTDGQIIETTKTNIRSKIEKLSCPVGDSKAFIKIFIGPTGTQSDIVVIKGCCPDLLLLVKEKLYPPS